MQMNIHGVVISKNDWGNLATTICHTISNHVDVVHVLDHGSSDRTSNGLIRLKELWNNRLKIYRAPNNLPFDQALLTNLLSGIAEKEGADWIYVFDSDEFLLTGKGGLTEELKNIGPDINSIRYKISNYISPQDFNRENLDDYLKISYESKPTLEYNFEEASSSIYRGLSTFFDYPFPSKIIFRTNSNLMIKDGAHGLYWKPNINSEIQSSTVKCAHLTYISRDVLDRKAVDGKEFIQKGYPRWFAWQSQLIYKISEEGWLDKFWERHSINENHARIDKNANYLFNDDFKKAISPTINNMKDFFGGNSLSYFNDVEIQTGYCQQSEFSFDEVVNLASYYEQKINFLLQQVVKLTTLSR